MNATRTDVAELVYGYIRRQIESGHPPTVREICHRFGWASTNGARYWLAKLEAQGRIKRMGNGLSRGIKLTEPR